MYLFALSVCWLGEGIKIVTAMQAQARIVALANQAVNPGRHEGGAAADAFTAAFQTRSNFGASAASASRSRSNCRFRSGCSSSMLIGFPAGFHAFPQPLFASFVVSSR